MKLFVGLGNPGLEYALTRHNIGFLVIAPFAERHGLKLKGQAKFLGRVAKGVIFGEEVILLMPETYMNESGRAVRKVADFYKVDPSDVLVITDDADLPFGQLRLREQGGTGGHNGLKSVQEHLGTSEYCRLRIGVGKGRGELADHVLDRFSKAEREEVEGIVGQVMEILDRMTTEPTEKVMKIVNTRRSDGEGS